VLFNGFKPLFEALSPADINKLSYEIVTVFQGEGGTLESLLSHTASVTSTLASRDQVIGSLITNLNKVMVTIGNRDAQLSDLLVKLRQFVSGLSQDRQAILGSLDSISGLAVQTSDLVTGVRPGLTTDVKQLRHVAGNLDRNKAEIDRALQVLPVKLTKIGRTATYGSFFNFYLCNFKGNVKLGKASLPIDYPAGGERCDLG
jgi:phospholipid/cholesterol/gamma-HCH transport system substrate-binding protein